MEMKILILMMWMGSVCAQIKNEQVSNFTDSKLTSVPNNLNGTITQLYLGKNRITLSESDRTALLNYCNLTVLHLDSNNITMLPKGFFSGLSKLEVLNLTNNYVKDIARMAFEGLENLKILDLSYNQIAQLPVNMSLPSRYLEVFTLQNNSLTSLDIPMSLWELNNSLSIVLSGNPWICNCTLLNLRRWLNGSTIKLENENITLCAAPKNMNQVTIKEAPIYKIICEGRNTGSPTSVPVLTYGATSGRLSTDFNETTSTLHQGNSWAFLVGVVVVAIITSLLILFAVKFPRWYDYLLSYNHHRLKEEEPYMFEEEFNVDFDMRSGSGSKEEEETVVVFEQLHSFVPEEDGFIEDKYIDDLDIRAES
ncbi:hypothetical protein FKM82_000526 [Ascaphus truei]